MTAPEYLDVLLFLFLAAAGIICRMGEKHDRHKITALEQHGWDTSLLDSLAGRAHALAMFQSGFWPLPRKS